jgi:SAM-dependent methyltransferase
MSSEVEIFEDGQDKGFIGEKGNWWFDSNFEHSFEIFNLDAFYQEDYFSEDHVDSEAVKKYVDYTLKYGEKVLNKPVNSVLELGCGGGWFTEEFLDRGIDITAVEGSKVGYEETIQRVPEERVINHDLRNRLDINQKFDIALCTEVAEHIEPPFSSQLVQNATNHSDLVWFSFEEPETNENHYHHMNEQPAKFWHNLFQFYGYEMHSLPEEVTAQVSGRGEYLILSDELDVSVPDMDSVYYSSQNESIGMARNDSQIARLGRKVKPFCPPIIYKWAGQKIMD